MPTHVKNRIEFPNFIHQITQPLRLLPEVTLRAVELERTRVVLRFRVADATGVERCFAAGGRRYRDGGAGFVEDFPWVGEFGLSISFC